LARFLKRRGLPVHLIDGVGFRLKPEPDAHPELLRAHEEEKKIIGKGEPFQPWSHTAVLVGETVVDLTGAQFGEKYAYPYYSFAEFERRWDEVYDTNF
jgi:hypothetical protein